MALPLFFMPTLPPTPACADCLFMEASLVAADRLYTSKCQILEEMGLGASWGRAAGVL